MKAPYYAAIIVLSVTLAPGLTRAQSPQATSLFQVVRTPNENFDNGLLASSASSPTDIWAVGQSTIHFDGTTWTAFPAPMIKGDNTSQLNGVVDISPTEAWAAGIVNISEANPGQVIEQWNGTEWSVYPGLKFTSEQQPALYAMTAVSSTDIWAVGSLLVNFQALYALFEHWDGSAWTVTTGPLYGFPSAVSADASDDIWMVGCGNFSEHYNGTKWAPVATPNVGTGPNCLSGVLALAPDNVWAVGYSTATQKPPPGQYDVPTKTLIEHYDGTSWSVVASPNVGPNSQYQSNRLRSLTAVSPTDIWAFGSFFAASGSEHQMTLLLHWDGTSWSLAASPNPFTGNFLDDILFSGVVAGPNDVWLFGSEDTPPYMATLALHSTTASTLQSVTQ
jgi:hypothetical protein